MEKTMSEMGFQKAIYKAFENDDAEICVGLLKNGSILLRLVVNHSFILTYLKYISH